MSAPEQAHWNFAAILAPYERCIFLHHWSQFSSTAKGQAKPVPTLKPVKDIFVSLLQMFDSVAEAVAAAGLDQD